ncbi:hypothetical protein D9613_010580 [Agrocybe pediades]|uniref:Glycoside hydrolase family 95 protein n=1 Tax=Agrocybe pediades TaxID=84607 RepID=A0A8H4QGF2_9AGAR|nr:hypothetical protein D9613_010580 [Agrocybe pediades]
MPATSIVLALDCNVDAFSTTAHPAASGNGLWYSQPANNVWSRQWLPIGNGYLAAMLQGGTVQEATQLNIESLWTGGPFADPSYNGGNKQPSEQAAMANAMRDIRQTIFQSPTGDTNNISILATDPGQYGSFAGAGYFLASVDATGPITNYGRWLDLDQALTRTTWTQNNVNYLRTTFCSNPTRACVQHLETTSKNGALPKVTFAFSAELEPGLPSPNITCLSSNSMLVNGFISESPPGMEYALIFNAFASSSKASVNCIQIPVASGSPPNATLQITSPPNESNNEAWVVWTGDTEFDQDAGDAAHNFTFRGENPVTKLKQQPVQGASNYNNLLKQHVSDINDVMNAPFSLDIGQKPNLDLPTDVLKNNYSIDGGQDNAYVEWVLFNYARYMLVTSSRGVLPANLQGKWANGVNNAWGVDYHANINLQMNYWIAEITGLSGTTIPVFNYIEKNWAPRGAITAKILYNISRGWVTHDEMNIYGNTGMKPFDIPANNYPEAPVWMMLHVWDHFDHTNDVAWWKAQGWPLIKGVASFHLDKLIPDLHFNDSTLVTNPCNSPEQDPITFGCANAQQLIWQLFNAVEKGFNASGDNDVEFLAEVRAKRAQMDKGLKIGSWGQLQEWKVEKDSPTDTHRHLSHLVGLYPGYAIANFDPSPSVQGNGPAKSYTKNDILNAAETSLIHRGNGTGPDADSGWEKVWRAAAWAQLKNSSTFYHELSYAIYENFGANLFSLYNPEDPSPIFQIDANFGYAAALMNALIQAPDVASADMPLVVNILPALPTQWPTGSIKGARIRGGITVDIKWNKGKLTSAVFTVDPNINGRTRPVQVMFGGRVISSFTTSPGLKKTIQM